MSAKARVRCAIYTRKSTDEGLEQEFNTLKAQREACASYIASQRHEGWRPIKTHYDDGGYSGGTLERPALFKLMEDVDEGRVDMVVVYKIDRLTRSLADFAKLVDRLDKADCSFVSVTQAFNTSTSMGRLTLNVLLSFAQFEREVTAERIRDKIAASKKRGLWMGGHAPLGYDPHPDADRRELIVNDQEAADVRTLSRLYAEHGNLRSAAQEAVRVGIRSKKRVFKSGRRQGGGVLTNGQIHHILRNPVYRGKIRHKDKIWPGLHPAIIEEDLWLRVQERLDAGSRKRSSAKHGTVNSPILKGKLRDETGDRLTPTYATTRSRRFRYYVSKRLIAPDAEGSDRGGWRLPGRALERTIARLIASHLEAHSARLSLLVSPAAGAVSQTALKAQALAKRLREAPETHLPAILDSGDVRPSGLMLRLDRTGLADALGAAKDEVSLDVLAIDAPMRLRQRGVETRMIAGEIEPVRDTALVQRLAEAHAWIRQIRGGASIGDIAAGKGCTGAYIRTRAALAFLSPKIQTAILKGRQPASLSVCEIIRKGVPLDWCEQEKRFGFDA